MRKQTDRHMHMYTYKYKYKQYCVVPHPNGLDIPSLTSLTCWSAQYYRTAAVFISQAT